MINFFPTRSSCSLFVLRTERAAYTALLFLPRCCFLLSQTWICVFCQVLISARFSSKQEAAELNICKITSTTSILIYLIILFYFFAIYPCAFNSSAQRTAPPAAPLTVLWESPTNFQSYTLSSRIRPTDMPMPFS